MKKLLAYLQLLRLPNVFTAMADIFAGFLISHGSLTPSRDFLLLLAASSCIYLAGMALNDWFDLEVDRVERPQRPLPSGRVPASHAIAIGALLLIAGVAATWAAGVVSTSGSRPAIVATMLVAAVVIYDGIAKQTALGPAVMGLCRTLNVFLGMSTMTGGFWLIQHETESSRMGTMAAAALGLYVMGVTRFARNEAREGVQLEPVSNTIGFNLGLLLYAMLPQHDGPWLLARQLVPAWPGAVRLYSAAALWLVVVAVANGFVFRALTNPQPKSIQQAVKSCILSIIVLDAALTALVCGPTWAAAVLALLVPSMFLGRWVYST